MGYRVDVILAPRAMRALQQLESAGMTRDDAVSYALVAAVGSLVDGQGLRDEVAVLESDPADRTEMAAVGRDMASLRLR